MKFNKYNEIISIGIVVLLFTQVSISLLLVKELSTLRNDISHLTNNTVQLNNTNFIPQSEVPEYVENVSIDDDPWKGTEDAPITIVAFSDYQCPACSNATSVIDTILEEYEGQIKFVYRDLPLDAIHPDAFLAAEAANCAGEQDNYWEMHDTLFENQLVLDRDSIIEYATNLDLNTQQFTECLDSNRYADEIRNDIQDASEYQVNATPTFFINGQKVVGARTDLIHSIITGILEG